MLRTQEGNGVDGSVLAMVRTMTLLEEFVRAQRRPTLPCHPMNIYPIVSLRSDEELNDE